MSKKIVPSFSSVRSRKISIERSWRSSNGGRTAATNGSSRYFRQRMVGEQRNHFLDEVAIARSFDSHGQLHRGSLHFHRRFGVFVHGAVNDVGPFDQFRHLAGIEAKPLFGNHGNETGAGLEGRIIELAVALILLEVGGVVGRKKSAFVVIEPPGDFGRTGILEIDNGILVAIELVSRRTAHPRDAAGRSKRSPHRCGFVPGRNARTGRPRKRRQNICRDKRPALAKLASLTPVVQFPGVK